MALADEVILERPVSSVFAAGKQFYLYNNIVLFSQTLEGSNVSALSLCYQKNDPTAEEVNDILDTDGGSIPINGATNPISIKEAGNGVLVFFSNGVWEITGPETGFTATNFTVTKISVNGCISAKSIVQVSNTTYYWGDNHIHKIQLNDFGRSVEVSIVEDTIKTFYSEISLVSKTASDGFYNPEKNTVEWFYSKITTASSIDLPYAHRLGITLDLRTGGFFVNRFNGKEAESTSLVSSLVGGITTSPLESNDAIYVSFSEIFSGGNSNVRLFLGKRDSVVYHDFDSAFPLAFMETGYETLQKPSNIKTAPYIMTHFQQTEESWIADGSGGFKLDNPSSCLLRSQWDWNNSTSNGRFTDFQQVYRFRRINVPSGLGLFNSGESVISTKNKVLGRGKALSLRFAQTTGHDLQLLGYTIQWSVKGKM